MTSIHNVKQRESHPYWNYHSHKWLLVAFYYVMLQWSSPTGSVNTLAKTPLIPSSIATVTRWPTSAIGPVEVHASHIYTLHPNCLKIDGQQWSVQDRKILSIWWVSVPHLLRRSLVVAEGKVINPQHACVARVTGVVVCVIHSFIHSLTLGAHAQRGLQ